MFFCSRDTLDHLHNYTPKTNSTERLLYNEKPDFRSASLPSVCNTINFQDYEAGALDLELRSCGPEARNPEAVAHGFVAETQDVGLRIQADRTRKLRAKELGTFLEY